MDNYDVAGILTTYAQHARYAKTRNSLEMLSVSLKRN